MINRCTNPSDKSFAIYGGRGISVCPQWIDSFEQFLADMGTRPSKHLSIDRIDNDGAYTPENCRWASRVTQNNNTRKNKKYSYKGKSMTLSQWSAYLSIPRMTLWNRVNTLGWSIEASLQRRSNQEHPSI